MREVVLCFPLRVNADDDHHKMSIPQDARAAQFFPFLFGCMPLFFFTNPLVLSSMLFPSDTTWKVDVVEAAYKLLQSKLGAVRDFVSLQRAHQEFLATLRSKFYIDNLEISQVRS